MSNPVSLNTRSNTVAGTGSDASVTPANKAKLQMNANILQASLSVSIGSQNDPLALVYKSALTSINEALKADYGENAVQNAVSQDNTPEGTAGRIVSLSTGFFDAYKKQNPGLNEDEALDKFMDTIKGGFEKGFKEARDILQGLKVLGGDIAANLDKTYELVQKGYADFVSSRRAANAEKPEQTPPTKPTTQPALAQDSGKAAKAA
ncbi:DUF5610 domain-containing protein [Massilia sp. MB5]|uniref:DUF5610 domain-containing protein n=1 Tax=unclassified Massilia TaxID=2609279 RepID=UPI000A7E42D0|nr:MULTISPECIES: DUF5610 domain-containing protein [unclassified Massilia]UMR33048.1 DUF5610 domain-containing protein [Massilia sp. MB5]